MARARLALLVPLALLLPAACADDDGGDTGAASASGSEAEASSTTTTERPTTSITEAPTTSSSMPGNPTSTTTPAGPGIRLTGDRGSGTFAFEVQLERGQLCYRMAVEGIGTGTAARIERADGSPVLNLIAPESGDTLNTCVASDGVTLQELEAAPAEFRIVVQGSGGRLAAALG